MWFVLGLFIVGGVWSFMSMGKKEDSTFVLKTAVVTCSYPGATPLQVEQLISEPVARELQSMRGVHKITSESYYGYSKITVELNPATRADEIPQLWDELRRKVTNISPQLPAGAGAIRVNDDFSDVYGLYYGLVADDGFSWSEIRDWAQRIKTDVVTVDGVQKVALFAEQTPVINLYVTMSALANFDITPEMIVATISQQNAIVNSGRVVAGEMEIRVLETGVYGSVEDIADQLLIASDGRHNIEGQLDLFGLGDEGEADSGSASVPVPDVEEYSSRELMAMERETTGLYLTGHPMDDYRALAQQAKAAPMGDILASFHAPDAAPHRYRDGQRVVIAGICTASRERATRKNTRMAYLQIEDDGGSMEVLVFSPALDACRDLLAQENPALFVAGRISTRDESDPQLVADKVLPLTEQGLETLRTPPRRDPPPRPAPPKRHRLWVRLPDKDHPAVKRIELILEMFPGDEQLVLVFEDTGRRAAARCIVHPALVEELRELAGPGNVAVTEEKTR